MIQQGDTVRLKTGGKFWPYGSTEATVSAVLNDYVYFEKESWVYTWQVEKVE